MQKEDYIKQIIQVIEREPDIVINGNKACHIVSVTGNKITLDNFTLTTASINENNQLTILCVDKNGIERNLPLKKITKTLLKSVSDGLVWLHNPMFQTATVKARTKECIEEVKKYMDELVERAIYSGAFDIKEAFNKEYFIPKAVVVAICMQLANEYTESSSEDIMAEAENIFQFL